jgi:hypothetical protein
MANKNEFEDLDVEEMDLNTTTSDEPQDFSNKPTNNDMIASGNAGTVFDWSNAPDTAKAPPRIDLNGKVVIVKKADIILPPADTVWKKTKAGDKDIKTCQFVLYYDIGGQQEYYSGVKVFRRDEKTATGTVTKYSMPTITKDGANQASALMQKYAEYKKKDINEVSMKEFMAFLNSQPKAKIAAEKFKNPETNEFMSKNIIGTFLSN